MFREADIRAYDPKRDAMPAKQPRRAKPTTPQKSSRSRYTIDPEAIAAGQLPDMAEAQRGVQPDPGTRPRYKAKDATE